MRDRILVWLISGILVCINVGCLVIPIPPGQRVYITQQEIERLVEISATRETVLAQIGQPEKRYKSNISCISTTGT